MAESVEDLKQRLEELERLVKPYYEPPAGEQYSFPTERRGITQQEFRLMHLGQANGMIHGDNGTVNDSPNSTGYRYYLDTHDSDAVTNERNTLILRAGTSAESIVEGFYHRLTEDMELEFPPVTTRTIYHVCITYDPRKFKNPEGPLSVQVYAGEPPETDGRVHLILHTVDRRPNQLLTQATRTRYRQYTAGLVSTQNENQLPDPASVPAGTLAVPSAAGRGIYVRANTGLRWDNPLVGPWTDVFQTNRAGWTKQTGIYAPMARMVPGGVQLKGFFDRNSSSNNEFARITDSRFLPSRTTRVAGASSGQATSTVIIRPDGDLVYSGGWGGSYVSVDGIIFPLDQRGAL